MNNLIRKIKGVLLLILICLLTLSLFSCGEEKNKEIIITGESTVYVGEKITLKAEMKNVEGEIVWESSDAGIATVSSGEVTGIRKGTVTISAKVDEIKGEIEIEVMEKVKEDVTLFCGTNIINDEIIVHKKVELALVERESGYIDTNYDPYDYNEVNVYAIFTSPDKSTEIKTPAFWYRDYTIVLDTNIISQREKEGEPNGTELVKFNGEPEYRIRFMPNMGGTWTYKVYSKLQGCAAKVELSGELVVNDSDDLYRGLIQVDKSNNRTLMYQDGTTYVPVGENIAWWANRGRKTYDYYVWFSNANKNDMNFARLWLAPWSVGLHWGKTLDDYSDYFSRTARIDRILEYAEQFDIYIMLALLNHGQFSTTADSTWKENPYNVANGGFLAKPEHFFTNREAKERYKNELLYLIGRYGYSDHILSWELFNEVDWTDNADINVMNIRNWHEEMGNFIKENDSYGHMVSTSYKTEQGASFYLDVIDFASPHSYGYGGKNINTTLPNAIDKLYSQYKKPIFYAEIGIDWQNGQNNYRLDPKGISLRQNSWAGMLGGGVGGAMNWWWDSYVHPYDLYYQFKGAGTFGKLMDLTGSDYTQLRTLAGVKLDSRVGLVGYKFNDRIYGYVFDKDWTYFNETDKLSNVLIEIPFNDGNYKLAFYNATTGVKLSDNDITVTNGVVKIDLPDFTNDVAFIIEK